MKRRKIAASFTVEASFIIPLIFFIIVALIYLCIFMYDKSRLQTDLILGLEYAGEQADLHGAVASADVEKYVNRRMQAGYLACEISGLKVLVTDERVTISAELAMRIPDSGLVGMLTEKFRKAKMVLQTDITNREKVFRVITGIG